MHTQQAPVGCTIEGPHSKGKITDVFYSSSARDRYDCHHGTIVMVEVTEGEIANADGVAVRVGVSLLTDRVVRIEREYQPVGLAKKGDEVGICLALLKVNDIMALGKSEWECDDCGSSNPSTAHKCVVCGELAPM